MTLTSSEIYSMSRARWLLYPLGVYTAYVGVTHLVTQQRITQREATPATKFNELAVLGRYENPFKEYRPQTLYEFLVMRAIEVWVGEHGSLHESLDTRREVLGWQRVDVELVRRACASMDCMSYTWIGQSCALVTMPRGPKLLLDPLFENHLVSKLGPQRILPVPLSLDELMEETRPEYVVVSHNHPDHLEAESVRKIGDSCEWIVPVGVGKYLRGHGITRVREMTWWERAPLDPSAVAGTTNTCEAEGSSAGSAKDRYEIVCLPAMHWSGRVLVDANTSLWSSFLILRNGRALFYHGGDTGYVAELFQTIGERYGPVKFGALPIGQYCPEWHQAPRHISPSEAIQVCRDMRIEQMAGVHWGTFVLSSEPYWDPAAKLRAAVQETGYPALVPSMGGTIQVKVD